MTRQQIALYEETHGQIETVQERAGDIVEKNVLAWEATHNEGFTEEEIEAIGQAQRFGILDPGLRPAVRAVIVRNERIAADEHLPAYERRDAQVFARFLHSVLEKDSFDPLTEELGGEG